MTVALSRALPAVYAAAGLRLAAPLLLLPVMALRLGPEAFGRLGLLLVWAGLLALLVEGGFLAAATRHAVQADTERRLVLAQQIASARLLLSLLAVGLVAALGAWLPVQGQPPSVLELTWVAALACALGWPATWYWQATQQLGRWAQIEFGVYALWLPSAWLLAHSVADYLALQTLAMGLLATLGWWRVRTELAPVGGLLQFPAVVPGLRLGWSMLPVSLMGALYSFALPALASARMAVAELGVYYLADRIVRALLAAADPVYQLVYPRLVQRFVASPGDAWRLARRWAVAGLFAGVGLWVGAWLLWPLVAPRLVSLPPGLGPVLAVLGLLLPILLGWKFLGYAMLGSARHDRAYRLCVMLGGLFGLVGAWGWAAQGAQALAWVAIVVELIVILIALAGLALGRRPLEPA